jgi:hypothetical protein
MPSGSAAVSYFIQTSSPGFLPALVRARAATRINGTRAAPRARPAGAALPELKVAF